MSLSPNLTRFKTHFPVIALIVLTALLRLAVIGHFGFGVDEAHYVLYGLYSDLSYFDHPPMVGWVEALFTAAFGVNEFAARTPAVFIGTATTGMLYLWLLRIFGSSRLAFLGAAALNASFLFNALFMMLMPDTLLYLLIVPVMTLALRIEQHDRLADWLMLGVLLGVAGLSKYTAFLFVVSLIVYFALQRRWDLFLSPRLLPAVLFAAVTVSPVLIWNAQHDWISFAFQSSHVTGSGGLNWNAFGQSLGAQMGAYSPFLAPIAFYGLFMSLRSREAHALFISGIFGAVLMAFFTYNSFFARALPHWTSLFYLLFIPVGTVFLYEQGRAWRRYTQLAVAVSALITLLLYAELRFRFLPLPDYKSIHRDIYGWDTIMKKAVSHIADPTIQAAAVTNWSLASRAIYYGLPYGINVFLIDERSDQFDLWQKGDPAGRDLLFITTHDFNSDIAADMRCESTEPAETFDIEIRGRKVNRVTLTWCRGFDGLRR